MTAVFNTWFPVAGCSNVSPQQLLSFNMELLGVLAVNSLTPLTYAASGDLMLLIVNGQTFTPVDGSFAVTGQTIAWTSSIYSIAPTDTVVAIYSFVTD